MSGWAIVVDRRGDFKASDAGRTIITTREYIAGPQPGPGQAAAAPKPAGNNSNAPKVINLARTYSYLGAGYYCSLLAEARGHRVIPTVETILELRQKSLYGNTLPELEEELNRRIRRMAQPPEGPFKLLLCFGYADDPRFEGFARHVFDWFRVPLLEVKVRFGERMTIASIRPISITDIPDTDLPFFDQALDQYTKRSWRTPKTRPPSKYSLAVLHNPREKLPPSAPKSLQKMARVAETMGVEVEFIEKRDFLKLAEFDALFIRETTAIDDHTYRFATRAEWEGMPVIDDPTSILRCTNKVYLAELMKANKVPTPKTIVVDGVKNIERLEDELPYPIVLKIPDGSFSRGIYKAKDRRELSQMAEALLDEFDLILAQEYMYTDFDWRVGVLDGEPLFVSQYLMAKKHWQIVKHDADGKVLQGNFKTIALEDAPPAVVDAGVRAARLIGKGLYGVDLKQNDKGVFVIEVNDNPNLDAGVEDAVTKDELWRRLIRWFTTRLD